MPELLDKMRNIVNHPTTRFPDRGTELKTERKKRAANAMTVKARRVFALLSRFSRGDHSCGHHIQGD